MKLTIDNHEVKVKKGTTVLDMAEANDIYIPHLCSHPELTPYGGCRLCIVEVDGMRGYPTACTVRVEEGMVIRTNTKILKEMRKEVTQLILSEHPSGCLLCDDTERCAIYQGTIRKVGVTTGCRWCPNDSDCELQRIVENFEIDELTFPGLYRGLPLQKSDPFFDRDNNLCIYCGRCVRICREQRRSSILSQRQRGKQTTVGIAFDYSHVEVGCEFCGACVSICPTGALSEKTRKWWGVPQAYHKSVCPLCSLNCDIQALSKQDKLVGTLPPGIPHHSGGELCVKGRFCLSELVNRTARTLEPEFRYPDGIGILTWDEAVNKAEEGLKAIDGQRAAVYLSPGLTLEELAAAKQFATKVLKTKNITSSVLDDRLVSLLSLTGKPITLKEIERTRGIVSIFLNGNHNYAPLTLAIKKAAENSVPYFRIGWTEDTTSRFAAHNIRPEPGEEKAFFAKIVQSLEKGSGILPETGALVKMLKEKASPTIIVGPGILDLSEWAEILKSIQKIISLTKAKIYIPNPYGNLFGLLSIVDLKMNDNLNRQISDGKIDLLYLIGDGPFQERPPVKFIVYQGPFRPPDELAVDLVLPAAMWSEISGTFADMTGHKKKFKVVTTPAGIALTHREIFMRIANSLGKENVKFTVKEIDKIIPRKLKVKLPILKHKTSAGEKISDLDSAFPYLLIRERSPHLFHNLSLSKSIEGMSMILPEETIVINPADAAKLGVKNGDSINMNSADQNWQNPVIVRKNIPAGFVCLVTSSGVFAANPCPVNLRRNNV